MNEHVLEQILARLVRLESEVFAEDLLSRRLTELAGRMAKYRDLFPALVDRWTADIEAIRDGKAAPKWKDYAEKADAAEMNNRTILLEKFRVLVESAIGSMRLEGEALPELGKALAVLAEGLLHPANPTTGPRGFLAQDP